MEDDQRKYNFIKEMLIAFIIGGSLGLVVLVVAELIVQFLKKWKDKLRNRRQKTVIYQRERGFLNPTLKPFLFTGRWFIAEKSIF
jgi:hypothetical protein